MTIGFGPISLFLDLFGVGALRRFEGGAIVGEPVLIGKGSAIAEGPGDQGGDLGPDGAVLPIDRMDGNAEEGMRGEPAEEQSVPCEAELPPPCAADAPNEGLGGMEARVTQVENAAEAGGVFAAAIAQGGFRFAAEEPGGGDESGGIKAEFLEIGAGGLDKGDCGRAIEIVEFAFVGGIELRGEFLNRGFGEAAFALMEVAVDDDLMAVVRLGFQPRAESRVGEEMAAMMVIRDDEEGALLHAEAIQGGERLLAILARVGRDIVKGYHERAGSA